MEKLIVEKSITIKAPPAKVWNIITSPETFKHWMLVVPAVSSDSPLQLGSKVLWNNESGQTYLTGTVVTLAPRQRLVLALEDMSWTDKVEPSAVTSCFALTETEHGTDLEFRLGDLSVDAEGQQWFDAYNASRELDTIKELAEGQA